MKMKTPSTGISVFLAGLHIAQLDTLHNAVPLDLFDDGVPDEVDLFIGEGPLLQRRPGAQFVAAVDDGHLVGELGQEDALFHGAVAAADDGHILAAEKEPVTCAAIADAAADELRLARHVEVLGRRSGGHDHRVGRIGFAVGLHGERRAVAEIDLSHLVIDKARTEVLGLLLHQSYHIGAGGRRCRIIKAWIILYLAGEGNLSAKLGAGDDHRLQQSPRCINGGR
jgi:hypothetical protein